MALARARARTRSVNRQIAQLCTVLRVPGFFSDSDIASVFSLREEHRARHGPAPDAREGWHTTYISAAGLFAEREPALLARLHDLALRVDPSLFSSAPATGEPGCCASSLAQDMLADLEVRCAEVHEGSAGGSLNDPRHFDSGSVVTVDVLLGDGSLFEGGGLMTLEADGSMLRHTFERGDALVFPSYKYHTVEPIEAGVRQALVLEFWNGDAKGCNHRCDVARGDCSELARGTRDQQEGDAVQRGSNDGSWHVEHTDTYNR